MDTTEKPSAFKPYSPGIVTMYGVSLVDTSQGGFHVLRNGTINELNAPGDGTQNEEATSGNSSKIICGQLEPTESVQGGDKVNLLLLVHHSAAIKNPTADIPTEVKLAAIFGYAYEGHAYYLDRPKVYLFRAKHETDYPAVGGNFDLDLPKPALSFTGGDKVQYCGYKMWFVEKLDRITEINLESGFVEQLILEANMPGNKSPNTYAGNMRLAHRSGRLNS